MPLPDRGTLCPEAMRFFLTATVFLVLVFAGLQSPAGAEAGSYFVLQCGDGLGSRTTDGSSEAASSGAGNIQTLPITSGACNGNKYVGAYRSGATKPDAGGFRGWRWDFPTGLAMTELKGGLSTCRKAGSNVSVLPQLSINNNSQVFDSNAFGSREFTTQTSTSSSGCGNYADYARAFTWAPSGSVFGSSSVVPNLPSGGASSLRLRLICGDSDCGTNTGQYVVGDNLRMKLDDSQAPTVDSMIGPWSSDSALGGVLTDADDPDLPGTKLRAVRDGFITASFSDSGGGLYGSFITRGLAAVSSSVCTPTTGTSSRYSGSSLPTRIQPCPAGSSLVAVTSASSPWTEGLNRVGALAYDYANNDLGTAQIGNTSDIPARRFIIDRTAPTPVPNFCYVINNSQFWRNGWGTQENKASCSNSAIDFNVALDDPTMVAGVNDVDVQFWQSGSLSYAAQVLRTGPRRYWPMNTGDSSTNDISVAGSGLSVSPRSGTAPVFVPTAETPAGKGAWDFSANSKGLVGSVPNQWDSETVTAWVRPQSPTGSGQAFISEQISCTDALFYFCAGPSHWLTLDRQTNALTFQGFTPESWTCSTSAGAVKANQWSFIVATRRANKTTVFGNTSGEVTLFVNGVEAKKCTNTAGSTGETNGTMSIGSSIGGGSSFNGLITQVAVFDGYLSVDDVKTMYRYGCVNPSKECYGSYSYKPVEGETTVTMDATDRVGNTSSPVARTVKIDFTTPVVRAPKCSGTEGKDGWYTSAISCVAIGADNISKPKVGGLRLLRQTGSAPQVSEVMPFETETRTNLIKNPGATAGTREWTATSGAYLLQAYKGAVSGLGRGNTSDSEAQGIFLVGSNGPSQYISTPVTVQRGKRYVCSLSILGFLVPSDWTLSFRDGSGNIRASSTITASSQQFGKVQVAYEVPASDPAESTLRCGVSRTGSPSYVAVISSASVEQLDQGGAMPFFDGFTPGASWSGAASLSSSTLNGSLARGTLEVSAEGESVLQSILEDNAGHSSGESSAISVKIDRSDPSLSVSATSDCYESGSNQPGPRASGWFWQNVLCQPVVSDAISGPNIFSYSTNGGTSWTDLTDLRGTGQSKTASWAIALDTPQPLVIKTRSEDKAGRVAAGPDLTLKIDRSNPTANRPSCTGAPGKEGWVRAPVTCNLKITDTVSGPAGAIWNWSSATNTGSPSSGTAVTLNASGSGSFTLSQSELKNGYEGPRIYFGSRGQDVAGRDSSWAWSQTAMKIDATPPLDATPEPSGSVSDNKLIVPQGTDPGGSNSSGVDTSSMVCSTENLDTGAKIGPLPCSGGIPITTGSSAVQSVKVTYTFADRAGNTVSGSRTYMVDNNRPSLEVSAPSGWSKDPVTVTLQASKSLAENSSPLSEIRIIDISYAGHPDMTAPASDSAGLQTQVSGASATGTATFQAEGERTVTFAAFDAAGNRSEPVSVTVRIDKTAPVISSGPTSSEPVPWKGVVSLSIAAADPPIDLGSGRYQAGSGLDDVDFEICPVAAGCEQQNVWKEITTADDRQPLPLTRQPGCGEPNLWSDGSSLCWFESSDEAAGRSENQVRAQVYDIAGNRTTSPEEPGDTDNPYCAIEVT